MPKIRQKFEDSTQCKTDRVEIDLWEFKKFAEQSITMLGQMFNIITHNRRLSALNPLCAKPTKWSNTLKQFVGKLPTNCLSVFDHFVIMAFKGLKF